jgi:two-component system, chemotaxis family, response regulator Rcp1
VDQPSSSPSATSQDEAARNSPEPICILLVEDNRADVTLVREALEEHGLTCKLLVLSDGEQALKLIARAETGEVACPELVILDLNLPKADGRQVLQRMRASSRCSSVPVVILSSSEAPEDIDQAKRLGATRYLKKPSNLDAFLSLGAIFKDLLS